MEAKLLSLPILALFVLAIAFAGGVMIRLGLRGRRIDDHPVCRKCGFDLFGLPDDQKVCPECGSDLNARSAVQIGHYERRRGLLWSGVSLLALLGLILVAGGTGVARGVDWQRLKPTAWVAWEARGGSKAAWTELTRRTNAGELSSGQAQSVTDDVLAWQKDLTRKWDPALGDFVEAARTAKLVTDEQWKTYATQATPLTLQVRPKVRKGDPLTAQAAFGPARVGSMTKLSVRFQKPIRTNDPLIDVKRLRTGGGYSQSSLGGGMTTGVHLPLNKKAVESAPPGKRTTNVTITAEIREAWETPGFEFTKDLSADWELLPADAQTVEVIPDSPALHKQMEAGLKVEKLEVSPRSENASGTNISLNLKIAALPAPISHDVYLREGAREWKLTSIATSGPTSYGTGGYFQDKDKNPFDARRVDVIFRPATQPALNTIDLFRRWDGELVVRDVEVKWPTTQPATSPR